MKTYKIIALSLLLGFVVFYVLKKKMENQVDNQKGEGPNKKTDMDPAEVRKAFLLDADNFQGIYEPLYKASQGIVSVERKRNVLREWDLRMRGVNRPLKDWWTTVAVGLDTLTDDELKRRAQQVVAMLGQCGVVRDGRTELVAEADTSMYYQNVDGKVWSVGQRLRVESPCWYINCQPVRILEKGCCEIL